MNLIVRMIAFLLGCALIAAASGVSVLPWLLGIGLAVGAVWLVRDIKNRSAE